MACLPVVPRWLLNSRAGLAGLTNGFHAFRMSKSTYPCVAWRSRPPFLFTRARRVVQLAANHALPTLYYRREFADAGDLLSYGSDPDEAYHTLGLYAGRILKGEKPADLPVFQPTKFQLVINLKTAKALGLAIPPSVLAIADAVIE